jgi:hypothetical protein
MRHDPSDDELVAFAAKLLSGIGENLEDPELLRETVLEARELWLRLYRVSAG